MPGSVHYTPGFEDEFINTASELKFHSPLTILGLYRVQSWYNIFQSVAILFQLNSETCQKARCIALSIHIAAE